MVVNKAAEANEEFYAGLFAFAIINGKTFSSNVMMNET